MSDVLEGTDVLEVTSKNSTFKRGGEGERGVDSLASVLTGILLRTETIHKKFLLNVHFPKY